jgi:hypothetical protein
MLTFDTVSVAEATALLPPAPVQSNEYEVVALTEFVSCVPLPGKVPLHPSPAVHEAALVEAQVKVAVLPGATTDGYTLKVAVGITLTVVLALAVPPGPEQDSEYEAAPDRGPVLCVPLTPTAPLQAPEAVHEVAPEELHESAAAWPATTEEGVADSVALGINVTVAETGAVEPPAPVHTSEKAVVALMGALVWVPLGASVPLQPPDAVHSVALVEFQVSDAVPPRATELGVAASVAVGRGLTVTEVLTGALVPPGPEHVSTKLALPLNAPLLWLPLVGKVPLQSPDAVQEVACSELHVSVVWPPAGMELGSAASCAVGNALTLMVRVAGWLVPPGPTQVSVNVASLLSAPVLCEPLTASGPLQSPEALQDEALLEVQFSVADAPASIVVGDAVSETVGIGEGAPAPPPHADSIIGPMIRRQ